MTPRNRGFRRSSWTGPTEARTGPRAARPRARGGRAPARVPRRPGRRARLGAAPSALPRRSPARPRRRRSSCVLPDDAQARDAAEAAGWYLGEDQVGLFASRGVRWGSGLEPPPHLVGERARALEVLAAGGLVCASALGLAEGVPPAGHRPEPIVLRVGDEPGAEALAERLALAGLRARRRRPRSAGSSPFAAGSSTSSRPPAASRSASSSSATRSSRCAPSPRSRSGRCTRSTRRPSTRRPSGASTSSSRCSRTRGRPRRVPDDLVMPHRRAGRGLAGRRGGAGRRARSSVPSSRSGAALRLSQLPAGQRHAFEAQRPAVAARGLAEAERDLLAYVRGGNRVVVTFAHLGEAQRTKGLLRRLDALVLGEGDRAADRARPRLCGLACPPRVRPPRPRPDPPPGHPGLPQAPASHGRQDRPGAPELRRPAHRRPRRPRRPRSRQAARLRDEDRRGRHARLSLPRVQGRRPPLRSARADREGLALRRRERARTGALQARR